MTPFSDAQPLLFRASSAMMGAAFGFRRAFLESAEVHAAFLVFERSCSPTLRAGAREGSTVRYRLSPKLDLSAGLCKVALLAQGKTSRPLGALKTLSDA